MAIGSRPPTIDEAVEILLRMKKDEFRIGQVIWWRERLGDEFADTVRKKAWEKIKKDR